MTADNGKQALDCIKQKKHHLISLDLEMPKMRRVKLLKYLQKSPEWADIPFIIVTSLMRDEIGKRDMEETKAKKIVVGPHAFMEEPILPSEYTREIRRHLEMAEIEEKPPDEKEALRNQVLERLGKASKDDLEEILKVLQGRNP